MSHKEILLWWKKKCDVNEIPWYLYGESLLCLNGLQDFYEAQESIQVAVLSKDYKKLEKKVFSVIPKAWRYKKQKSRIGISNVKLYKKRQILLSITILFDNDTNYYDVDISDKYGYLKKEWFTDTKYLEYQDVKIPVFGGYKDFLYLVYGDYEKGLFDEFGVGLRVEEKEELREHQERCKEALLFLKNLSVEFKLRYYLLAGSVLGAERHQGFIPWDDDIDIGIRVEDLDYFESIVKKYLSERLPEGFSMEQRSAFYPYPRMFSKICYKGRCCIDLWPLVPVYTGAFRLAFTWFFARFITKIHYVKIRYSKVKYKKMIKVCSLFIKDETVIKLARKNERKYINRKTPAYINLYSIYSRKKELILREWLDDSEERTFEGITVPVVGNTKAYLMQLYGNYMELPLPWKRSSCHIEYFAGYKKLDK